MNCSEPEFLEIRQRSCFQINDGNFVVKIGLLSNLNFLLDFLKQKQQKLAMKNDSLEADSIYPGLPYEFVNKHPLLKIFIDWYLSVDQAGTYYDDKYEFLKDFINTIIHNMIKPNADPKYLRAMRLVSGFFGSIPNFQIHEHPQAFKIQIKSQWPWFYLRKEQLLLFLQDATHLVTKWRNRLLSSTAELRIGSKSISVDHLYDIISNPAFTKFEFCLTKSDINPKDRQNFSSCLKLTFDDNLQILSGNKQLPPHALNIDVFNSQACKSIFRNTSALSGIYSTVVNFTVHGFLQRAQKLSLLNDIKYKQLHDPSVDKLIFSVHYKHRNDRQSLSTQCQNEIDQLDVEQVIADTHDEAVDIFDDLEVLDLLQQQHVLDLKPLSEYVFGHLNVNSKMYNYSSQVDIVDNEEFELATDDDDEVINDIYNDDYNCDDSCSDNDHSDNDEQDVTTEFITTTKKDFSGIKVGDTIKPVIQNSYFKVSINNQTKYLHKQSACWLLTDEKSRLSSDRLLRVMQNKKKE
ncbi:unnamed protein product [Rotaria sordida]|uniref:Uncharacterized protein n=1 Tax=Rotaria sordida TaxID=392033 RepID=A0A815W0M3_9BILA|nr:unnamed protein product [Rotaria sordida]CAF1667402.1 unnamed protein product [Rotaria sordida]